MTEQEITKIKTIITSLILRTIKEEGATVEQAIDHAYNKMSKYPTVLNAFLNATAK